MTGVGPSAAAVIGGGRVGTAISRFYKPAAPIFDRNRPLPAELTDVPVWVCTTNDGLDRVLHFSTAANKEQQRQLIFVQNGMLLPWLAQHRLQHNTQVLLYMSASEDGVVTDGGRTAVCGPWAHHVAATLTANGVCCSVVQDWGTFHQLMLVKLLWACVFWLLSAGLGGKPVGVVAQQHTAEVSELVAELLPLGQQYLRTVHSSSSLVASVRSMDGSGVSRPAVMEQVARSAVPLQLSSASTGKHPTTSALGAVSSESSCEELSREAVMEQLLSYSLAIAAAVPSVDMARREFAWRNGFFLTLPQGRTPRHCDWLVRAGCKDLLESMQGPLTNSP